MTTRAQGECAAAALAASASVTPIASPPNRAAAARTLTTRLSFASTTRTFGRGDGRELGSSSITSTTSRIDGSSREGRGALGLGGGGFGGREGKDLPLASSFTAIEGTDANDGARSLTEGEGSGAGVGEP